MSRKNRRRSLSPPARTWVIFTPCQDPLCALCGPSVSRQRRCVICAPRGSPWATWEPDVECQTCGPSARRDRPHGTLNSERPRPASRGRSASPQVVTEGARRAHEPTA